MEYNDFKDIKCNFNLYRAFYAVALTGSFSEAARLLYVSQPSLSYNVKQLEEQLNINLFYRKINGVSLTNEGEKLLSHIKDAFSCIIEAEEALLNNTNKNNSSLIIGGPTHIINFYLLPIICKYLDKYPNTHLKIIEKSTSALKEMLQKNEIDIMVDDTFNSNDAQQFEISELIKEKCCFAGKKELIEKCKDAASLSNSPLILPSVGGNLRKIVDEYFSKNHLKCNPLIEAFTTETIVSLTKEGKGVGFFYEDSIREELDNKQLFKYSEEIDSVALCCMHQKKNNNEALNSFMNLLINK